MVALSSVAVIAQHRESVFCLSRGFFVRESVLYRAVLLYVTAWGHLFVGTSIRLTTHRDMFCGAADTTMSVWASATATILRFGYALITRA
jgi:hypothetical protein